LNDNESVDSVSEALSVKSVDEQSASILIMLLDAVIVTQLYLNVIDGQRETDGQTDDTHSVAITAVCVASRSKNSFTFSLF